MMPTAERVGGPPTRPARGVRPARPPPPAAHLYRPPPVDHPRQHQRPPPPPRASCPPRPLHVGASNGRHAPRPCGHVGGLGGGRRAKWCGKAASWAWLPLNAAARVESALNTCWPAPSLHVLLACLPCLAPSAARFLSLEAVVEAGFKPGKSACVKASDGTPKSRVSPAAASGRSVEASIVCIRSHRRR
ncbi:uncharacterized protein LOC134784747 [Penaeus indicus]|uniref:uncharacterized protein LOC134784747 n=1 Tax=Penaeus indicus TaxID=29960 RepID=UPI00300BFD2C